MKSTKILIQIILSLATLVLIQSSCTKKNGNSTSPVSVGIQQPEHRLIDTLTGELIPINAESAQTVHAIKFSPKRFYGPFTKGSDLRQIKLWLIGEQVQIYFDDFFNDMDDEQLAIYEKYIYPFPIPTIKSPNIYDRRLRPGREPSTYTDEPSFGDILFTLNSIEYSEKYGGSLLLKFESDHYGPGYELKHGDFLWDFNPEFHIYLNPRLNVFNGEYSLSSSGHRGNRYLHYEMVYDEEKVITYINGEKSTYRTPANAINQLLGDIRWREIDQNNDYPDNLLFNLAHAWFQSIHYEDFPLDDKIMALQLFNDGVSFMTEDQNKYAVFKFRITNFHCAYCEASSCDLQSGTKYIYDNGDIELGTFNSINMESDNISNISEIGRFKSSGIMVLNKIELHIRGAVFNEIIHIIDIERMESDILDQMEESLPVSQDITFDYILKDFDDHSIGDLSVEIIVDYDYQ